MKKIILIHFLFILACSSNKNSSSDSLKYLILYEFSQSSASTLSSNTTLKSTTLSSAKLMERATTCTTTTCTTPSNMSGKAYYAGIMITLNSSGSNYSSGGYSLGPILGNVSDPSKISKFTNSSLLDFDFASPKVLTGSPVCCGGTLYPPDAYSYPSSVEIYFAYIDTTFKITSGTMAGTWVVRTYFGDIDGTDYKKGDLLIKSTTNTSYSEFQYISTAGTASTTRPSSPIQYTPVSSFTPLSSLGNQTIPTFSVSLTNSNKVSFPKSEVLASKYSFEFDFTITNAITWGTTTPSTYTSPKDILTNFRFDTTFGSSNNTSSGIGVNFTATKN
jgi:hypothetical protein